MADRIRTTRIPRGKDAGDQPEHVVRAVEQLARMMDAAFQIPGFKWRFGLDALLGLFPGLGDMLASAVSLYILGVAIRSGVPRSTLTRMSLNIVIDQVLGTIPVLGDVFDVWWKSNLKNAELLRQTIGAPPEEQRRRKWLDWLFLAAVGLLVIGLLTTSLFGLYLLLNLLWSLVQPAAIPAG